MHDRIWRCYPKTLRSFCWSIAKSGGALGLCGSDCYLASWSLVQSDAYIFHILQGYFLTLSSIHSSLLLTPCTHSYSCWSLAGKRGSYAVELLYNLALSPVNIN